MTHKRQIIKHQQPRIPGWKKQAPIDGWWVEPINWIAILPLYNKVVLGYYYGFGRMGVNNSSFRMITCTS